MYCEWILKNHTETSNFLPLHNTLGGKKEKIKKKEREERKKEKRGEKHKTKTKYITQTSHSYSLYINAEYL